MEWVDTRNQIVNKIPSIKLFLKFNQNEFHWVGHSKIKLIDADEFTKSKEFNKIKNTEDQYEYASENASDTEKYSAVYKMIVTSHEKLYMDNKHVVTPVTADENNKKQWKTIYKEMD